MFLLWGIMHDMSDVEAWLDGIEPDPRDAIDVTGHDLVKHIEKRSMSTQLSVAGTCIVCARKIKGDV